MSIFKILFNGELEDDVFATEEDAEEYALYLCSCSKQGAEDLHLSNPGDYDIDCNEDEYEIIEIDE